MRWTLIIRTLLKTVICLLRPPPLVQSRLGITNRSFQHTAELTVIPMTIIHGCSTVHKTLTGKIKSKLQAVWVQLS